MKSYLSKWEKKRLWFIYFVSIIVGFVIQIPNHSRHIPWVGMAVFFSILGSPITFWALLLFLGALEQTKIFVKEEFTNKLEDK